MAKPDVKTVPDFYQGYVKLVEEESVTEALRRNTGELEAFLQNIPENRWNFRYAEGKWSIKEMVQHLVDAERIFSYRALCIARGEKQSLPGFDENAYAAASKAEHRNREDVLAELRIVRKGTEALFHSFDEEQLGKTGIANKNPMSVHAIGYIIAGHARHHLNVLKERYMA
jgi:uncharacterized damage-inducible protein DinB